MANINEGNSHNCYRCGRTFKNSRALCGHMWIHSSTSTSTSKPSPRPRNKKKTPRNNKKSSLKATTIMNTKLKKEEEKGILIGNQNPDIINVNCPHCDKSFPSMRSLHGHQRMHPGKVWRGIHLSSPSSLRVDSAVAARSSDHDKPGTSITNSNEEENNAKPSPTDHQLIKKRNETEESANSEEKKKKKTKNKEEDMGMGMGIGIGIGIGSYSEIFKRGFLSGKTLGGYK